MSCDPMLSCRSDAGRVNSLPSDPHVARHSPKPNIILLDASYAADDEGRPHFQALLSPDNEEVAPVTASLAEAITDFLRRRGLGPESDREESDPLSRDQPWLAGLYAASVLGRTAFGPNAGRRTTRTGDQIDPESMDAFASPRCANVNGFSLHANVALNGADRKRLERLIRYCARPPVAVERLGELPDGRVLYRLKRPWRNGATDVVFQAQERESFSARRLESAARPELL